MKFKPAIIFSVAILAGGACLAQSNVTEDFKPSTLNQPGQEYPQVNSQGYVRFRIVVDFVFIIFHKSILCISIFTKHRQYPSGTKHAEIRK